MNSAGGSFGLSFGWHSAGAIMLATLSITFTALADNSNVLSPSEKDQRGPGARAGRRGDEQHAA